MPVRVPSVSGSAWNDGHADDREVRREAGAAARPSAGGTGCARRCSPRRSRCRRAASDGGRGAAPMKQSWLYRSLRRGVRDQARAEAVVVRLGDRPVDRAPPDLVAARRLVDDELVLGRAAGVLAGADDERAVGRDEALAVADGVLVQLGGRQVGADVCGRWPGAWSGRWLPSAVDSLGAGDHDLIDRPRVMRVKTRRSRLPQSLRCADATTLRNGCGDPEVPQPAAIRPSGSCSARDRR